MRDNPTLAGICFTATLILAACASSSESSGTPPPGPTAAEPGHCRDRTRIAHSEETALEPSRLRPLRLFLQQIAPEGAELVPVTGGRPDIANRSEVAASLQREYPEHLKRGKVSGTARVGFFLDEAGRTELTRIVVTSGNAELDQAALRVAGGIRFFHPDTETPPLCWALVLPISFLSR